MSTMSKRFKIGDSVSMTTDAVENYGERWAGEVLSVAHVATRYMPAAQFYAQGKPAGYHPGFDEAGQSALYDLVDAHNRPVSFSLYDWELR